MKIFKDNHNRLIQLVGKDKIEKWDAELPLIFIGYIRENRLSSYPSSIQKEVEEYLEDVLESVAIPKLVNALSSQNIEERITVSNNILKLSEGNAFQLKIALPHIEKAMNDPNKEVASNMKKAKNNYEKAIKRKKTAAKRKTLTQLRKQMDEIDIQYADGTISDGDYLKEQKKYLKLKREIQLEEE